VVSGKAISPLGHFGSHLVLGALLYLLVSADPSSRLRRTVAVAAAVAFSVMLGAGIEVLQFLLTETRTAQVWDFIADTTGSVVGAAAVFNLEQLRVSRQYLSIAAAAVAMTLMLMGGASVLIWNPNLPRVGDHWHAGYRISVCGRDLPPFPGWQGGIHTHGDGVIHIHPFVAGEAGRNATLGLFFANAGGKLTDDSLTLPSGESYPNGTLCPGGQSGKLRVMVDGKVVDKPSTHVLRNKVMVSIEIQAAG
jgi:hypothetical protein